uniref:Tryptophan 5-hydroxylase 2 n=1 Tax=Strigamia maritima TaxID=126957 RepID=T1J5F7_STRMM
MAASPGKIKRGAFKNQRFYSTPTMPSKSLDISGHYLKELQAKIRRCADDSTIPEVVHGPDQSHSVVFPLKDQVGGLSKALKIFQEKNINVLHIESRKSRRRDSEYEIYVDVECDNTRMETLVGALKNQLAGIHLNDFDAGKSFPLQPTMSVDESYEDSGMPWFPKKLQDFDICANRVLMYGAELDADHPGFKDTVYRQRRKYYVDIATNYKQGQVIPRAEYTEEEINTWRTVFRELTKLYPTHACKEYLSNLQLLIKHCGYREDNIPQLEDINNFLKQRSGFLLRPVAGYLSSRDFLAGLAFRLFHCTQYIRHSSDPFYTPEPDCCHELLGHMPMLADPSFAQFSQEIGLASLGASDEEVSKMATVYFFTIEFGLCKQNGELRVFGAGLLSSVAELKHALSDKAVILPFEPERTSQQECLITTFQDVYFHSDSFETAKEKMRGFADTITRPFGVRYNPYTQSVEVLSSTQKIASIVSELKGDLCIVTNALRKIQEHDERE